jgi:hypothetical protein
MVGSLQQRPYVMPATLSEQATRQLVTYWRVRIAKTLDHFESEIRRMLRVEDALESFAQQTTARLSPYMASIRQLSPEMIEALSIPRAPFEWSEKNIARTRALELKNRYRQLAKEMHPDYKSALEDSPSMTEINAAYGRSDLALLIRLEAQAMLPDVSQPPQAFEDFVRQVELATQTYRGAYSQLLHTPLYALYARAVSAQEDGWDWADALIRRIKRAIDPAHMAA